MRACFKVVSAAILLAGFGAAMANDDVVNTKHNLSTSAPAGNTYKLTGGTLADRVCVFCHTPHAGASTAPLWNRTLPAAGGFTMYSSATIDMTIAAGGPQGISLACLSCHDGATAFDALVNGPGGGLGGPLDWAWNGGDTDLSGAPANINIGVDLSNDHPISVTYDNTADTAFEAISVPKTAGLVFYGGGKDQVECATCHNPHEATLPTFLRIDNGGSALCISCHIK